MISKNVITHFFKGVKTCKCPTCGGDARRVIKREANAMAGSNGRFGEKTNEPNAYDIFFKCKPCKKKWRLFDGKLQ